MLTFCSAGIFSKDTKVMENKTRGTFAEVKAKGSKLHQLPLAPLLPHTQQVKETNKTSFTLKHLFLN